MAEAANEVDWSGYVQKKAFKVLTKANWKRRWLVFNASAFTLAWSDTEARAEKPKSTFKLDPNDIEHEKTQDHKKPFEMKVKSGDQTLFFCVESAEQVNILNARLDAARRLKVASVEENGTVFKSESDVSNDGNGIANGEQGPKVMSWGVGLLLGIGKEGINGMSVPQRIATFRSSGSTVVSIASGPEHAAALTTDKQPHMWGSNEFYQLSQPQDTSSCPRPVALPAFMTKKVLAIACGGSHTVGVVAEDGSSGPGGALFSWGTGTVGQLGMGNTAQIVDTPQRLELPAGPDGKPSLVTSVYAGLVSSAALSATGDVFVWGDASAGRLGLPRIADTMQNGLPTFVNGTLVWTPVKLAFDGPALGLGKDPVRIVHVALGGSFTLFLAWAGKGPGCSLLVSGALGVDITRDSYGYPMALESGSAEADREVQATLDAEVKDVPRCSVPTLAQPYGASPCVLDAFAGARHAAVIVSRSSDGAPRLHTAGKGWLGHFDTPDSVLLESPDVSSSFAAVGGLLEEEDVVQAGCGHSHTVARTADGRMFAWGRGDSGELGHCNLSDRSMPVSCRPVTGHSWTSLAAGSYYTIGIVEPSKGADKPATKVVLEGFKTRWTNMAADQDAAIKASTAKVAKKEEAAAEAAPADGKKKKAKKGGDKEAAAQVKAREQLDAGELPPDWNWEQTDDGEVYYIMPDGETQWDDPRDDWDTYWRFFIEK